MSNKFNKTGINIRTNNCAKLISVKRGYNEINHQNNSDELFNQLQ